MHSDRRVHMYGVCVFCHVHSVEFPSAFRDTSRRSTPHACAYTFAHTDSLTLTLTLTLTRPFSWLRGGRQHVETQCASSLWQLSRRHDPSLQTTDQSKLSTCCAWHCTCAAQEHFMLSSHVLLHLIVDSRILFAQTLCFGRKVFCGE